MSFSPPNEIVAWLACLGFLLWVCVLAKKLRGENPQPPNESLHLTYIALAEKVTTHGREIEQIWMTLRSEDTAIRAEISNNVKEYERTLGRIEGEMKGIHNELKRLNQTK